MDEELGGIYGERVVSGTRQIKGQTTGVLGFVYFVQGHGGSQTHWLYYSMLVLLTATWSTVSL